MYNIPFRDIKLNDSEYVDVLKHKDKNPKKNERTNFTKEEVDRLRELKDDKYYQIILMLIYNGCRISEFLDLKKENVHLDEQYFDVISSKTENGIRNVPISESHLGYAKMRCNPARGCTWNKKRLPTEVESLL